MVISSIGALAKKKKKPTDTLQTTVDGNGNIQTIDTAANTQAIDFSNPPLPSIIPPTIKEQPQSTIENTEVTPYSREGATYQGGTLTKEEYEKFKRSAIDNNTLDIGNYGTKDLNVQAALAQTPQIQQKLELQQALSQLGQTDPLLTQAIQEAPIDWAQAITAGTLKNLPNVIRNTAIGAAGGSAVPVVGTALGGVTGFISAVWGGIQSNIEDQQRGEIAATKDQLTASRTNMRQLAMLASQNPSQAETYIQLYNKELSRVNQAYTKLKLETQGNLNKFMEDGTQDLSDFEIFLAKGGTAELYQLKLRQALLSGQPMQLGIDDLEGL